MAPYLYRFNMKGEAKQNIPPPPENIPIMPLIKEDQLWAKPKTLECIIDKNLFSFWQPNLQQ